MPRTRKLILGNGLGLRRWLGRERALQTPVRIQIDGVSVALNHHGLEIPEIKAGKADGRVGLQPRNAPVSIGAILQEPPGSRYSQRFRIAEGQVIGGQIAAGPRVPGATRSDVVNIVSRIADYG